MRKSKPRTETRASQSRELGELSALARETVERKLPPDSPECIRPSVSQLRREFLFFEEIKMEKPKKLTKKQRLELLEQKRAAKAYCDELAKRNEFDYGNCWDYACEFGRGWEVDEIYNYLRRYC